MAGARRGSVREAAKPIWPEPHLQPATVSASAHVVSSCTPSCAMALQTGCALHSQSATASQAYLHPGERPGPSTQWAAPSRAGERLSVACLAFARHCSEAGRRPEHCTELTRIAVLSHLGAAFTWEVHEGRPLPSPGLAERFLLCPVTSSCLAATRSLAVL